MSTDMATALVVLPVTPNGDVDVPTDWWDTVSVGQIILGIVALLAIIGLVWKGFRALGRIWRIIEPFDRFLDDWNGEAPRPGVDKRPGVMERLQAIETHLMDAPTRSEFTALEKQVDKNTAVLRFLAPPPAGAALPVEDPTD